ncbi:hypothetical protein BDQ12DRAFT_375642 [Crucibulum laeve]|uniref:Uncharacterized protein n=1 Tax=Crucibulum laeve TaxID=68775 RepID=A0A5C3LLZ4_9AGAR|nr:hypothetical protein BDQ12DRAFT_375642 [Crucibulum laeve]
MGCLSRIGLTERETTLLVDVQCAAFPRVKEACPCCSSLVVLVLDIGHVPDMITITVLNSPAHATILYLRSHLSQHSPPPRFPFSHYHGTLFTFDSPTHLYSLCYVSSNSSFHVPNPLRSTQAYSLSYLLPFIHSSMPHRLHVHITIPHVYDSYPHSFLPFRFHASHAPSLSSFNMSPHVTSSTLYQYQPHL